MVGRAPGPVELGVKGAVQITLPDGGVIQAKFRGSSIRPEISRQQSNFCSGHLLYVLPDCSEGVSF